ncbi:MAG: site-specific integrase [Undibacterium sp.]|nr:site-specific integrase [Opitutaceae bacterium]
MRRSEIDRLLWADIGFHNRRIRVAPTTNTDTKTADSQEYTRVAANVLDELAAYPKNATDKWVVEATNNQDVNISGDTRYRANFSEQFVVRWLRKKGITRRKPLHELRKECGSIINKKVGLPAASAALRHGSLDTTAAIYVENRSNAVADPSDYRRPAKPGATRTTGEGNTAKPQKTLATQLPPEGLDDADALRVLATKILGGKCTPEETAIVRVLLGRRDAGA